MLRGLYTGKLLAPNLTSLIIMALLSRTSFNLILSEINFLAFLGGGAYFKIKESEGAFIRGNTVST